MKNLFTSISLMLFLFSSAYSQVDVTGMVVDDTGESLIGAYVYEKDNEAQGGATDIDGKFSITVSSLNAIIVVSYTGFSTQEIPLEGRSNLDVTLVSGEVLDEIVVIGYGTSSKRFLTDNVTTLTSSDIEDVPVSNFQSALSGKAAGVRITQTNGKVDAGINIRVRGAASISAGTQPLYVLDGIPLINQNESSNGAPTNPLLSLNPNEIQSIDILKDASSAAIYGARGANGVVLITTKRGAIGKAKVSLDMSYGTSEAANLVEWLETPDYVELLLEAQDNATRDIGWPGPGYVEGRFDVFSNGTDWQNAEINTDWNDITFRTGSEKTVNFSVSGGDQKTIYYFGGGYNDSEGILLGNALDRFNGRANLKHTFNDKFNAGLNLGISKTTIDRVSNDNAFTTPLQAIAQAPLSPARLENGEPFSGTVYPNFLLEEDYASYITTLRRATGKVFANYNIIPELTFTSDFGYDLSYQTENQFRGSLTPFQSTNGQAFASNATSEGYVFANYLTFIKDFGNDNLNFVLGTEFNDILSIVSIS